MEKQITFPFPYKSLENTKEKIDVLPEDYYCALKDGESIIVGPLNPCLLIALSDGENAIAFHKAFTNSIESLITIAKKEINISDPKKLAGMILTNRYHKYSTFWTNGRSQSAENKFLRKKLYEAFNIENKEQIQEDVFHTDEENDKTLYARFFVYVRNNKGILEYKNISPIRENIFGNFRNLSFEQQLTSFQTELIKYQKDAEYFIRGDNKSKKIYNHDPFVNYLDYKNKNIK